MRDRIGAAGRGATARQTASERAAAARKAAGDRAAAARQAAGERATAARHAATDHATTARKTAGERASAARALATDRVDAARARAEAFGQRVKPRLRGVFHQWAFPISLLAGGVLVALASGATERLALAIYAASLSALFGVSALYHRIDWQRPRARAWMRRLDHSMIFTLIAGTYTPIALLVIQSTFGYVMLAVAWGGALAGVVLNLLWANQPKWVAALAVIALGWALAAATPGMVEAAGLGLLALVAAGGALYTAGAVVYARQRPDPAPRVFGYHEIMHVLVIAAAAVHFTAIAIYALPAE